jgi:hypothetical protein
MVAGSRPTSGPAVVFGGSPAEPPQLSRGAQARNSQAGRYQEKNDGPLGNSDRSGGFRIVEGKTVGCAPAPVVRVGTLAIQVPFGMRCSLGGF